MDRKQAHTHRQTQTEQKNERNYHGQTSLSEIKRVRGTIFSLEKVAPYDPTIKMGQGYHFFLQKKVALLARQKKITFAMGVGLNEMKSARLSFPGHTMMAKAWGQRGVPTEGQHMGALLPGPQSSSTGLAAMGAGFLPVVPSVPGTLLGAPVACGVG